MINLNNKIRSKSDLMAVTIQLITYQVIIININNIIKIVIENMSI